MLSEIKKYEQIIENHENELKKIKKEYEKFLFSNIDKIDEDVINFLYWDREYNTQKLDQLYPNYKKILQPILASGLCKCGNKITKSCDTRTKLKDFERSIKLNFLICTECQIKNDEKLKQYILKQDKEELERQERRQLLKDMPYQDYLKSPEWQTIRLRKMKKCSFKCELCNNNGILNVHHKTYENKGNEKDSDLIVLCELCHKKFHDKI